MSVICTEGKITLRFDQPILEDEEFLAQPPSAVLLVDGRKANVPVNTTDEAYGQLIQMLLGLGRDKVDRIIVHVGSIEVFKQPGANPLLNELIEAHVHNLYESLAA
ncbi:MAG: hypothetical protein ACREGJ_02400 [Candidatus Saccharimonadales bacterium]